MKKIYIRKIFSLLIIFSVFYFNEIKAIEKVYIVLSVNNEIITNIDIKKEFEYLKLINKDLENIDNKLAIEMSKNAIVAEKIKKIEILKYVEFDEEDEYLKEVVKDFYKNLNFENEKELEKFLKTKNLSALEVKKKLQIETSWNELIYVKYNSLTNVNIKEIKKKLNKQIKKNKNQKLYLLSEIIFEVEKTNEINEKYNIIKKSIEEVGFANTANIYSISDTSNSGGKIGWVKEIQISEKLNNEIKKLKVGDFSQPIASPIGQLIIKLEEQKIQKIKINFEEELKKLISIEKNKKLNQFSNIYFKKIKENMLINEK